MHAFQGIGDLDRVILAGLIECLGEHVEGLPWGKKVHMRSCLVFLLVAQQLLFPIGRCIVDMVLST